MAPHLKCIYLALFALLFLSVISSVFVVSPAPRPVSVTKLILSLCQEEINRQLEMADESADLTEKKAGTESVEINRFFAEQLRKDTNAMQWLHFSTSSPPLLLDGWKAPLNFTLRSLSDSRLSASLLRQTNFILVWSSGPNRLNEYGSGDDLLP